MHAFKSLLIVSTILVSISATAALPQNVTGVNVLSGKVESVKTVDTTSLATVFIFLSAKCPCSNSHIRLIKDLVSEYKNFRFFGVFSNLDESDQEVTEYVKKNKLNFVAIRDHKTLVADQFKAFKTPHAFVVDKDSIVKYQGGVTDSSNGPSAKKFYLRAALENMAKGEEVKQAEGRTLGCVIMRENELPK